MATPVATATYATLVMLRPAVAVINCAITAEASGVGIGKRAPVGERKPGPAMPGVTGSATCPAGGNPSTTAGKQRYRPAFRRCRPEQASDRRSRTLPEPGRAELVPRDGARRD